MNVRRWHGIGLPLTLMLIVGCSEAEPTRVGPDAGGDAFVDPLGLQPFSPPADPGPGGIVIAASGESLALSGYAFPPLSVDDVAFVDGWQIDFDRMLTTVANITLSENPDRSPTDQSVTDGVVAEVTGPFAVDLHKPGALAGAGGGEDRAIPLAALSGKTTGGGGPFDSTARYAFGFSLTEATLQAKNVNLDADAIADYKDMVTKGHTVLFSGTARWKGSDCKASAGETYDFSALPKVVRFRFGFSAKTTYINCQNPSNTGKPFDGEEAQRGVQVLPNRSVLAQVTVHSDHAFWDSFVHDTSLHFDPIAARKVGFDGGIPTVTLDDLVGVDFTSFKDSQGRALPARSCVGAAYSPPAGALGYEKGSVPYSSTATPDKALRDFRDYVTYAISTMGHLNADGLCAVKRNYPSPP